MTDPDPTGILVIETDLNVDFAPPVGYVEPDYSKNLRERRLRRVLLIHLEHRINLELLRNPLHRARLAVSDNLCEVQLLTPSGQNLLPLQLIKSGFDPSRPVALNLPKNTMFYGISPVNTKKRLKKRLKVPKLNQNQSSKEKVDLYASRIIK